MLPTVNAPSKRDFEILGLKMPLGGLIIGCLGLIGNVFLIFLKRNNGFVFGQSSNNDSLNSDYFDKQISVKDIILQIYYVTIYGNLFASILLIIGTIKVLTFFFYLLCFGLSLI